MLPFWYTQSGLSQAACRKDAYWSVYIHPWEVDPDQPRLPGRWKSRLRHYTNLGKTGGRLRRLLELDQFASFRDSGLLETARPMALSI